MFKRFKERLSEVSEEVKRDPRFVSGLATVNQIANQTRNVITSSNNADVEVDKTAMYKKPIQEVALFSLDDEEDEVASIYNKNCSEIEYSFTRDEDLFPAFEFDTSVKFSMLSMYSDVESNDNVSVASSSSNLATISKERLLEMAQKFRHRQNKYKCRYKDILTAYKAMQAENDKIKLVMQQTQDKALLRIGELREQCVLSEKAKRHLAEELRNDIEEKQHIIETLETKIGILKSSSGLGRMLSNNCSDKELLIDLDETNSFETTAHLEEKVVRLEALLTKCKESIQGNKLKTSALSESKDRLADELKASQAKIVRIDALNETLLKEIQKMQRGSQFDELQMAQSKMIVHQQELSLKETEYKRQVDELCEKNRLALEENQKIADLNLKEAKLSAEHSLNNLKHELSKLKNEHTQLNNEIHNHLDVLNMKSLKEIENAYFSLSKSKEVAEKDLRIRKQHQRSEVEDMCIVLSGRENELKQQLITLDKIKCMMPFDVSKINEAETLLKSIVAESEFEQFIFLYCNVLKLRYDMLNMHIELEAQERNRLENELGDQTQSLFKEAEIRKEMKMAYDNLQTQYNDLDVVKCGLLRDLEKQNILIAQMKEDFETSLNHIEDSWKQEKADSDKTIFQLEQDMRGSAEIHIEEINRLKEEHKSRAEEMEIDYQNRMRLNQEDFSRVSNLAKIQEIDALNMKLKLQFESENLVVSANHAAETSKLNDQIKSLENSVVMAEASRDQHIQENRTLLDRIHQITLGRASNGKDQLLAEGLCNSEQIIEQWQKEVSDENVPFDSQRDLLINKLRQDLLKANLESKNKIDFLELSLDTKKSKIAELTSQLEKAMQQSICQDESSANVEAHKQELKVILKESERLRAEVEAEAKAEIELIRDHADAEIATIRAEARQEIFSLRKDLLAQSQAEVEALRTEYESKLNAEIEEISKSHNDWHSWSEDHYEDNEREESLDFQTDIDVIQDESQTSLDVEFNIHSKAQFQYLKNVLFKYMMGQETTTLARVLVTILKFSPAECEAVFKLH